MYNCMEYSVFFGLLEHIGGACMKRLLSAYGNEEEIFKLPENVINNSSLMTEKQKQEFLQARKLYNPGSYKDYLEKNKIRFTAMNMKDYPSRLLEVRGLPYGIFYKGNLPQENIKYVSIVGARMCSSYGREAAEYFAGGLASKGVGIISGGADGIDSIAQRKALCEGGKTYAVMGCGTDVYYPAVNKDLFNELEEKGGILSEFAPGTKPDAFRFPMRNRIISGLSDIVLVIEAKEKRGTSITVSTALEQGRDVYAVPGRINEALSRGCNKAISEGAGLASCVEDILEALGIDNTNGCSSPDTENPDEKIILDFLENGRKTTEEICGELYKHNKRHEETDISEMICLLSEMEMKGIVKRRGGLFEK